MCRDECGEGEGGGGRRGRRGEVGGGKEEMEAAEATGDCFRSLAEFFSCRTRLIEARGRDGQTKEHTNIETDKQTSRRKDVDKNGGYLGKEEGQVRVDCE